MKLFVYLPLAFKHDVHDALLISYGVGSTAKALADTHAIRHIDVVDISRDILEMSSIVYTDEENPLYDPRVVVHVEDGRFFLNASERRYDLITSEPPPPKIAGVVNLYSQEYFELIRHRLTPGGYASYWLPVHQLEPLDTLAITRAFCNAFPDCSLWSGAGLDWILLGSNEAAPHTSIEHFTAQWEDQAVRQELLALGFETPAQLGSLFMGDASFLGDLTSEVPPVTDNYPLRISSRHAYGQGRVQLYETLMDESERLTRFRQSVFIDRFWPVELQEPSERFFAFEGMIKNHVTSGVYRNRSDPPRWEAIDELLTETSLQTLPLWLLGSDADAQAAVDLLLDGGSYGAEVELELTLRFLSAREYGTALEHLETYLAGRGNVSPAIRNLHLYLLAQNDRADEAAARLASLQGRGRPGVERFVSWFVQRFELAPLTETEPDRREPLASAL